MKIGAGSDPDPTPIQGKIEDLPGHYLSHLGWLVVCAMCLNVIRKEAWIFCRTSSDVLLCWELEEPEGPKGRQLPVSENRKQKPLSLQRERERASERARERERERERERGGQKAQNRGLHEGLGGFCFLQRA